MEGKVDVLLTWLKKSDKFYIAPNISICESPETGRGIVLSHGSIRKNDIIVSVPSSKQLNFHTILYHISKFNKELNIPGITIDRKPINYEDNIIEAENKAWADPRYGLYSELSKEFLLSLSSFQLVSFYILVENFLLPKWTHNEIYSDWKPFFDVWPSMEELRSIPAIWNCDPNSRYHSLIEYLPAASRKHMARISGLVREDWETISEVVLKWNEIYGSLSCTKNSDKFTSDELFSLFVHVYFIINSRCLYAKIPLKIEDSSSNFTLVPYVDFMNHICESDLHCYPQLSPQLRSEGENIIGIGQFTIRCGDHLYDNINEELFLNYGAHSNDFLLNEYGFVVDGNKWNYLDISDEIIELIDDDKKEVKTFLLEHDYWGDYTINETDISYRIFVALNYYVTRDERRVRKFIEGYISEDYFKPKISSVLKELLVSLTAKYTKTLSELTEKVSNLENNLCLQNLITIYKGYIKILTQHLQDLQS
ncbi:Rkm2p [Saccharomyces cerevisiae YJM1208]|nr:Rkm2p [Saccharomyces cerevisiae YJM1208]AJV07052.1 Rkm2p [Saccharomyces cerevisiae YJM1418]CAD6611950.1 HLJ1_G0045620.mRNA.1.CDS.1 [Saccharomyces cerevisiae]CAI4348839.1 CCN_G0010520.mRNA.1.CDS.1 [Saccharomyces cerevisiae]CAI4349712.1 BAI_1a_G0010450.mRNA.1.CDS.1 [Saccharomyces cerevisiae]